MKSNWVRLLAGASAGMLAFQYGYAVLTHSPKIWAVGPALAGVLIGCAVAIGIARAPRTTFVVLSGGLAVWLSIAVFDRHPSPTTLPSTPPLGSAYSIELETTGPTWLIDRWTIDAQTAAPPVSLTGCPEYIEVDITFEIALRAFQRRPVERAGYRLEIEGLSPGSAAPVLTSFDTHNALDKLERPLSFRRSGGAAFRDDEDWRVEPPATTLFRPDPHEDEVIRTTILIPRAAAPRGVGSCWIQLPAFTYIGYLARIDARMNMDLGASDIVLEDSIPRPGTAPSDSPASWRCRGHRPGDLFAPPDCSATVAVEAQWRNSFETLALIVIGLLLAVTMEYVVVKLRADRG